MAFRAAALCFAVVFLVLPLQPLALGIDWSREVDRIWVLPGQPPFLRLQQYSGYVSVDEVAGKRLFYYFVEAPEDPADKPLVLWLNGGPGCSSLHGAFGEIGPFRVDTDGKTLCLNKYSWITAASLLFLEVPVGTGFSYADDEGVYKNMGDNETAADSLSFLLRWFDRFPEYKDRDFFIAGQSYAGHYIPKLAAAIQISNKNPDTTSINLQGIAIGNGMLEIEAEQAEIYEFLWERNFISDSAHTMIAQKCKGPDDASTACQYARDIAFNNTGDISQDNIYAPTCRDNKIRARNSKCTVLADPCSKYFIEAYFNRPLVQKVVHANINLKYPWTRCRISTYNMLHFGDSPRTTMVPYIKNLVGTGIRIWLYNGDFYATVPLTASKRSVEKLQLAVLADWRPWSTAKGGDVAGYVIEYKGLLLATVRGAGSMVPADQPERAAALFGCFLRGESLPPSASQTDVE